MNIATALNRKYLEYTAVMLCSLCENNHEHIDAYILHSELTDKDINTLKNSLSKYDITIIPLMINRSDFDTRLPRNSQWSIETYYRLMLMDILPDNIDRILYLDVDLIINGSVEEFYHVDFKGDEVIVADDSNGKRSRDTFGSKQAEMFKDMLDNGFRYFNAGVMLFNVQEIRKIHNFNTYMKAVEEWDYAKKTIFYNELLEKMQQNLMSDNSVEKIIDNLFVLCCKAGICQIAFLIVPFFQSLEAEYLQILLPDCCILQRQAPVSFISFSTVCLISLFVEHLL